MAEKENNYEYQREEMVKNQIQNRGIGNPLVLKAMRQVPRHKFMPEDVRSMAYADRPLPIGKGQTISQPYIVAFMTQCLRLCGGERVLEIGTGYGYQAAILSHIAQEVYTIERVPELGAQAQKLFKELGYSNIHCKIDDGTLGWSENAPYEGILVTASGPGVPEPLKDQLKQGGRLVIPVGSYKLGQEIIRLTKGTSKELNQEKLLNVAFVPLLGKHGWQD